MKKQKTIIIAILMIALLPILVSCSSNTEKVGNDEFADKAFIQDLSKGLEKRWATVDKNESKDGYDEISVDSEEFKAMMESYINAELEYIEKYQNAKFEDSKLQELAISYINQIKAQKDNLPQITVDYIKYSEELDRINNERSKLLSAFVESYGLTVDEKYQSELDDFLTQSKNVIETEKEEEQIEQLVKTIKYEKVKTEYGYSDYEAIIENTTDYDLKSFGVTVNLIDKDGIIVENEYGSLSNFKKSAKAKLEFSTDKKFKEIEVALDYYETANE